MSDNELRGRIEQIIENKTYAMAPDGFIAGTEEAAQAIIDDLGLIVVDVPGGISDYSPFTGKPVVQPDRWYVDGERVFEREPRP